MSLRIALACATLCLSACFNYGRWKGEEILKGRGSDEAPPPAAGTPQPQSAAPRAAPSAAQPVGYGTQLQPAPPPAQAWAPQPAPAAAPAYAPQPAPPPAQAWGSQPTPAAPAYTPAPAAPVPPPTNAAQAASLAPATDASGGQRIQPEGTSASLVVPAGWTHGWGSLGSERVYVLRPGSGDPNEVALIGMRPITAEQAQMPMQQLLEQGAQAFGLGGQIVAPPSALDIGGKRGGRMILRQQTAQGSVESYLGAVVDEDVAYVVLCNYRPESNRAPTLDAVLQSMRVQAPPVNQALTQRLTGCWEKRSSSGGGSGYAFSETRWFFQPDGSYRCRSSVAVSVPGASGMSDGGDEVGRYRVRGNVLSTQPQTGEASSYDIAMQGGMLYIGQDRFLPCR